MIKYDIIRKTTQCFQLLQANLGVLWLIILSFVAKINGNYKLLSNLVQIFIHH